MTTAPSSPRSRSCPVFTFLAQEESLPVSQPGLPLISIHVALLQADRTVREAFLPLSLHVTVFLHHSASALTSGILTKCPQPGTCHSSKSCYCICHMIFVLWWIIVLNMTITMDKGCWWIILIAEAFRVC